LTFEQGELEAILDSLCELYKTKIWRQIRYILVPSNNKEKLRLLGPEVSDAFANGTISFAALTFVMKDDVLSQFISEPCAILNALYLGPLGAPTVEVYLQIIRSVLYFCLYNWSRMKIFRPRVFEGGFLA
ncbi:hypothetical protein ANCDUO_17477, partial [Ancylostoma duodenale]